LIRADRKEIRDHTKNKKRSLFEQTCSSAKKEKVTLWVDLISFDAIFSGDLNMIASPVRNLGSKKN
jgi:hypothetical protein